MSDYMKVLAAAGIVPFALSFWPGLKLWSNWRALFASIAGVLAVFGAWDVLAVSRGHWRFSPQAVSGVHIVNLPLEEVLFFVVIPFCCIFTWEVINYFKRKLRP